MITAQSITKRYGSLEVLKGIDFCAKEKEIISIVGASGAGKSTLLMQTAQDVAQSGYKVLYVSGEESESQLRRRAARI